MDHLTNLDQLSALGLLLTSMLAGLLGSAHCVGMCGGLVSASTKNIKQNFTYQIGRLLAYMSLALILSVLSIGARKMVLPKELSLYFFISFGLFFIYLGFKNYLGKTTLKLPPKLLKGLSQLQTFFFRFGFKVKSPLLKPFLLGAFSIFLPCGFLYLIVFAMLGLQNLSLAVIGIMGFWLGTLPALVLSSALINKVLLKFATRHRFISSLSLVALGLGTIIYRLNLFYQPTSSCH